MPLVYKGLCDFTGGEFSPQMSMRIDLPEYNKAVAEEQNFYTLIQGGAKKRRGQAFVTTLSDVTQQGIMIPYVLNTTYSYLVVINNGTMIFAKNGNIIPAYSIPCPYTVTDLPFLRYAQSGSILYLFHPNYPIFSLQCNGDTNWILNPVEFTYNATSDVNFSNAFINFEIINGDTPFSTGTSFSISTNSGVITSYNPEPTFAFTPAFQAVNLASDGRNFNIQTGGIGSASAPIIMDGINLEIGMYVLLKDQTAPEENGVYLVNTGAWSRPSWYNTVAQVNNSQIHVDYGLIWGNQYFNQTTTLISINSGYQKSITSLGALGAANTGSGYDPGTYYNVPLIGGTGSGAQATIYIANVYIPGADLYGTNISQVQQVLLTNSGYGYTVGDILTAPSLAYGTGFYISVATVSVGYAGGAATYVWTPTAPGDGVLAGVTSQLGATGTYVWTITCISGSTSTQTWQVLGIPATQSGTTFTILKPTYISPTSFSMVGDQTAYFPQYQWLQFDDQTTLSLINPPAVGTVPTAYVVSATYNGQITTVVVANPDGIGFPSDILQVSCLYYSMWKPGAYPNAGCFYEGRLMTGGSAQFPQYIWGSRAGGQFLDFTNGITADMGIIEEIAGNDYNQIVHLVSSRQLLILTTSTEFAMFGPNNQALSGISSNIVKDYTHNGCSEIVRPIRIGKEVLFAQRDGAKVRAISYQLTTDSNVAPDITLFSNHLTIPGTINSSAFAQNPDYISWWTTTDGRLLSCAFDRDHNVVAWAEHTTNGIYEAVCCVPGISYDYTYVIVNRTINGQVVRFVELMDYSNGQASTLGGPTLLDCFFVYESGSPTNSLIGLPSEFYGATGITVVVNGTIENNHTVSNTGSITTLNSGTYFCIGFPYTAQIQFLTPEFGDANNPTMTRQKGLSKVFINVYNTTDLWFNPGQLDTFGNQVSSDVNIPFLTTAVGLGETVPPFTGLKQADSLGWLTTNKVWLKSPNPTECQILGVVYKGGLGE